MTTLASTAPIAPIDPNTAAMVGYAVMAVVAILAILIGFVAFKVVSSKKKQTLAEQVPVAEVPAPVVEAAAPSAPGSAGQLKLHDVEPRTAAMLMAIVAYKMDKPLNELRFISIKEVK